MRKTQAATAALVAFTLAGPAFAQVTLSGKIVTVDITADNLGIMVVGNTVGAEGPPTPTQFKVQDPRILKSVKPGDQVLFTAQNINGVVTIKNLTKE